MFQDDRVRPDIGQLLDGDRLFSCDGIVLLRSTAHFWTVLDYDLSHIDLADLTLLDHHIAEVTDIGFVKL